MRRSVISAVVAVSVLAILVISPAFAVSEKARVRLQWDPPQKGTGSEVVRYRVWIQFWNPNIADRGFWGEFDTTTETSYILECYRGMNYMTKVYAEDADGNLGPASPDSDPLFIPGAEQLGTDAKTVPPPPGKPKI